MIIEQNTNYAYRLQHMDDPSFEKIRELSVDFYRSLPPDLQDELFDALNRGVDVLDSEPQMTTYMFSYGKMHQAKLKYAYSQLPIEFLEKDVINIIDYGCGQALGTMCYADFLQDNGYSQKIKTITLIEPSEMCLKRAALHVLKFFPKAIIKTKNKKFDNLTKEDIACNDNIPTLHLLSNVLDLLNFDLDKFVKLEKECIQGYNHYVCVGPYFKEEIKDSRLTRFTMLMKGVNVHQESFESYEFDSAKPWTCSLSVFYIKKQKRNTNKANKEEVPNYERYGNFSFWTRQINDKWDIRDGVLCGYTGDDIVVEIPNDVTTIREKAFKSNRYYLHKRNNPPWKKIIIPNSVTRIMGSAFSECFYIEEIIIPSSVKYIGPGAFYDCRSMKTIKLPDTITTIDEFLFWGCSSLHSITLPRSVKSIEWGAFQYCTSLKILTIPSLVERVGAMALNGCSSLKQIVIPRGKKNDFMAVFYKDYWKLFVEQQL